MEIVDPRNYHGFCLRGEGRMNVVISAKNEQSGQRIVWRLAKQRKTGFISNKQKGELLGHYVNNFISPFINEAFLIKPRIVTMRVEDLKQIAKIPSLPHNFRIDCFDELGDNIKYPQMSLFPHSLAKLVDTYPFIDILEMADATRIPKRLSNTFGPTITIELKPKQGFFQQHPGINVPYCNNCVLQIEKSKSGLFNKMYDFCPLDLFSGNLTRMYQAIDSLIVDPHRNLRIFVDGTPVHDEEQVLSRTELESLLFPNTSVKLAMLIKALCCVLAGVKDDSESFYLRENSILSTLLKAQKIDPIGIVKARQIYEQLPVASQAEMLDKANLLNRQDTDFLTANDARSLLERYILAGTTKDCSLMISFRLVHGNFTNLPADDFTSLYLVRVRPMPDSEPVSFTYSIRVVDLDPKSPKNLLNGYQRFINGVNTILNSSSNCFHKPCQI